MYIYIYTYRERIYAVICACTTREDASHVQLHASVQPVETRARGYADRAADQRDEPGANHSFSWLRKEDGWKNFLEMKPPAWISTGMPTALVSS